MDFPEQTASNSNLGNNGASKTKSEEKVIIGPTQKKLNFEEHSKNKLQFCESEVEEILSDFKKLNFKDNECKDPSDVINYNEGREANPFDKIAKYYGRNKDVFLFISLLQDKKQLEKIINIIGEKCDVKAKEKFVKRMNIYLDRISQGERDANQFLNTDLVAFFNGYHVACPGHGRNIHENLNINTTKPGQVLEPSSFFNKIIKRMEEEKSEVKKAKIYNNGKRITTIAKNDKQQRNYSFTEFAVCDIEISWGAKDESGRNLNCAVVLNINLGQITIRKSTIDGNNVESEKILELAKKNKDVLIRGEVLHEVLECLEQVLCEEAKRHENIVIPDSGVPNSSLDATEI